MDKKETETTNKKDPILESCSITFKQQTFNKTVRKCYKPTENVGNGQGEDICQTFSKGNKKSSNIETISFINISYNCPFIAGDIAR